MENNRHGCRWTKASDLPKESGTFICRIEHNDGNGVRSQWIEELKYSMGEQFIRDEFIKGDVIEWLDESIEPCADENEFAKVEKHKCQYCGAMTTQPDDECWNNPKNHKFAEGEDDIANDFHKAIEPCATSSEKILVMNKDKAIQKKAEWLAYCLQIGFLKSDLDKLSATWDKFKDEYGNIKPESPSPTGDRDCEELKHDLDLMTMQKELGDEANDELAESLVQLNKVKNRFKDLVSRIVGSMALERVERFDLNNEAKELLKKHP